MAYIRMAVRIVLLDDADRTLLLWHAWPHADEHWAPPGGGIETGETPAQAATRELAEETGFNQVSLRRPVWKWQHRFVYDGVETEQHETIFISRVPHAEPEGAPRHLSEDGIVRWRWWTLTELQQCREEVWPYGLADVLPAALAHGISPRHPADLGFTVRP